MSSSIDKKYLSQNLAGLPALLCVFFVEFCYMGMELLASRLLSPFFGTTLDVWTAILATVLAAGAVGNTIGAKLMETSHKHETRISACIGIAAATFACMPALSMLTGASFLTMDSRMGAMSCAIILFFLPGVMFGIANPVMVDWYAESSGKSVGAASGRVSAVMTLGGIAGTIMCGFVLVPILGARDLATTMSVIMFFIAFIVGMHGKLEVKSKLKAGVCATVLVAIAALGIVASSCVLSDAKDKVDFWRDTEYGHVHVFDSNWYDKPVRVLNVDGGFESAMNLYDSYDLVFDYTQEVRHLIGDDVENKKVICLGGGAYSIPKALAHDGASVTAIEIDSGVTNIAREWFDVAEVEKQYDLHCENADGRIWLEKNTGFGADVVFNDTFAGEVPARTLATVEAIQAAKKCLAKDGLYIVNVIGIRQTNNESILADEVASLEQVFENVYVFGDSGSDSVVNRDNYIVVATDNSDWRASVSDDDFAVSADNVRPLTDDWCPVEWLVAQERNK